MGVNFRVIRSGKAEPPHGAMRGEGGGVRLGYQRVRGKGGVVGLECHAGDEVQVGHRHVYTVRLAP